MVFEQRIIMILKFAVILTAVLLILPLFISDKYIFVKVISEDGYYSLTVAKNIAQGHGMTIDGTMLANGFQPLFTLICVIPFFLAGNDLVLAYQILYGIHLLIFFATAWVMAVCVQFWYTKHRKIEIFWGALFLYLSSLYLFDHHMNGLETGLVMLLYVLIWRYIQTRFDGTIRSSVILGILFGLLVLSRIDAGFFCAFFALVHLWNNRAQHLLRSIRQMTITAFVAFIITLPWWFYNVYVFGSIIPTSGIAEQNIAFLGWRIFEGPLAIVQNLVPHIHGGRYSKDYFDLIRIVVLGSGVIIVIKNYKQEFANDSKFFIPLIFAIILLTCWYTITSYAWYFYARYLLPIVLLSIFYFTRMVMEINKVQWKLFLLTAAIIPLLAFLSVAFTRQSYESLDHFYRDTNQMFRLLEREVPPNEKIGSGQSGFLGFIRKGIVNLDGKVNLEALGYKDSIWIYMDKKKIQWFCDDAESMNRFGLSDIHKHGWELKSREGNMLLFKKSNL